MGAAGVVLVAQPHVALEDVDAALEVYDSDAAAAAVRQKLTDLYRKFKPST